MASPASCVRATSFVYDWVVRRLVVFLTAALCGCPSEGLEVPPPTADAGFVGTDGGTTSVDAGPRDGGVDHCGNGICEGGSICDDPNAPDYGEDFISCPQDCPPCHSNHGQEGGSCTASFNGVGGFLRDDCEADLICVPFGELSGRTDELNGPLQSCIRPCVVDADCGMSEDGSARHCIEMQPHYSDIELGRYCVDSLVGADQYCGASRNVSPRIDGVESQTGYAMVGCEAGLTCVFGAIRAMHPDEGVCLNLCGGPDDPPCPPETPYCNPNLLDGPGLAPGVCSVQRVEIGARCTVAGYGGRAGLTLACDTSTNAAGLGDCIDVAGVGAGVCLELCDLSVSPPVDCGSTDPYSGPRYCAEQALPDGRSVCATPNCGAFPDTCDGPGFLGTGRQCVPLQTAGDDGVCMDRLEPILTASYFRMDGTFEAGQFCEANNDRDRALRCPDRTLCAPYRRYDYCLPGCSRTSTITGGGCTEILADLGIPTSTAACIPVPGWSDPTIGVCAGE